MFPRDLSGEKNRKLNLLWNCNSNAKKEYLGILSPSLGSMSHPWEANELQRRGSSCYPSLKHRKALACRKHLSAILTQRLAWGIFFLENTLIWEAQVSITALRIRWFNMEDSEVLKGVCLFVCFICLLLSLYFDGLTFIQLPRARASGDWESSQGGHLFAIFNKHR